MIVKMNKLLIAGLMEERSAIVRRLMKLGVVELGEVSMSEEEREQALSMASFDDASKRIAEIDEELRKITDAIGFLSQYPSPSKDKHKKPKRELTYEKFVDTELYNGVWRKVFDVLSLSKSLTAKKTELNNYINERAFLKIWEGLQTPAELAETKSTVINTGTVPQSVKLEEFLKGIDEIGLTVSQILNTDKDYSYVSLITHKSAEEELSRFLKENGFSRVSFGDMKGTVADNIKRLDDEIKKAEEEIQKIIDISIQLYDSIYDIQLLYDYIYNMQQRRRVRKNFLKTDKAFIVGGWTPADVAESVKRDIENQFTVSVEIIEPHKDEETPVLLRNSSLVYPFEMITEMFSLPSSKGIDPNAVMAPFYWLFFGLMLGDAGYGILLTLICGIVVWKLKPEKGTLMDKMLKLLALCGISTFIWGAAFGGWFGDVPASVFNHPISPLWFDPNKDPMRLLIWSFVFGGIHLFTGMALNAYMLIRQGKWLDAIFDIGFWYVALVGLVLLFLGGDISVIGKYMAISGAIGLVLTQGRHEKNIIKKFTSGILSLYNATGFLGDVLSYSRLLALGLATGVVGQVINQLGILSGGLGTVLTTIILFIVLVVGHAFNMAINTLGAYVHSSRLQYVEFFGKFYESGGTAFSPLKPIIKYIKLTSN